MVNRAPDTLLSCYLTIQSCYLYKLGWLSNANTHKPKYGIRVFFDRVNPIFDNRQTLKHDWHRSFCTATVGFLMPTNGSRLL